MIAYDQLSYLYLFPQIHLRVRAVDEFSRTIAQKTCNHERTECLFGVMQLKVNIKPISIPKAVKI